MIYNRYLDIHLCTNTQLANLGKKEQFGGANPYFYEFSASLMQQMRYRDNKHEGFTFDNTNTANCKVLSDVELTHSDASFLKNPSSSLLDRATGEVTYALNAELKQIRYVGCMVAIENLKTTVVYPPLHQLMVWISDEDSVNKLRINSHGSGSKTGGMSMGTVTLSPDELIEALTRHGLKRSRVHTGVLTGLAAGARWRDDNESQRCQGCKNAIELGFFTSGKHHCRRCGGLFCDKCSSYKADLAVALTGKDTTAKDVRNARVCKNCYDQVKEYGILARSKGVNQKQTQTNQTNYGLKTICLACCMGAKADDQFSPEKSPAAPLQPGTTFVQDSLAARLLTALRAKNLTGIKVTASNQNLYDAGSTGGICASCGITVPTDGTAPSERHTFLPGKPNFTFPAFIWGKQKALVQVFKMMVPSVTSGGITVSPDGRCLYFSTCNRFQLDDIKKNFLNLWKFSSWQKAQQQLVALPGGSLNKWTWKLTAPPRVTNIKLDSKVPLLNNEVVITARVTETFKQYKSYEVS